MLIVRLTGTYCEPKPVQRPHPPDAGHETLGKATETVEEAEGRLLKPLVENGARQLKDALRLLLSSPETP